MSAVIPRSSPLRKFLAGAPGDCPWCSEPIAFGDPCSFVHPSATHSIRACLACGWAEVNNALRGRRG